MTKNKNGMTGKKSLHSVFVVRAWDRFRFKLEPLFTTCITRFSIFNLEIFCSYQNAILDFILEPYWIQFLADVFVKICAKL